MADEPTLPSLPGPGHESSRKRARAADASQLSFSSSTSTSSDPAFFSSDDDPALDNYIHGRRKKRYVGTWWDQQPASSDPPTGDEASRRSVKTPKKRLFRRQLDSGVWMGQDSSTDSEESTFVEPGSAKFPLTASMPAMSMVSSSARPRLGPQEEQALSVVMDCVDNGTEVIDLSRMGLTAIADEVLEPVSMLTLIPTVTKDVAFEHKDPSIKLFLSGNLLTRFPNALVNIEHLTVLSLRDNNLTELPPSIAQLKNLQTLNIARNFLRFLPSELLGLLKKGSTLRDLQLHPNPWHQPQRHSYCHWGTAEYEERTFGPQSDPYVEDGWSGITTILRSRTPVQFSDCARVVYSDFRLPAADTELTNSTKKLEQEDFWELALPREATEFRSIKKQAHSTKRVHRPRGAASLFEMALRVAANVPEADTLSALLESDNGDLPEHLAPALDRAIEIRRTGGKRCSVCTRDTLVPVTEWIEFRELQRTVVKTIVRDGMRTEVEQNTKMAGNSDESWVPFLHKGCSWDCVPHKAADPPGPEERSRLLATP